uniref:Uncharacterized protein n=1 Tax=Chromera velia CCMP2878 TaxID=1169474 RepID=A0A0G4F5E7_9ALVE|eukprot:Cvel_15127.t1-p1 / transcript=Cvel_15127.t1 / gene=Cvel_15127 / organism=Chromera_velia_CCMP2878 / gene_product=hypothetical protein / transcript_product=hypothetical protein / location=Cvel_scaffold1104:19931-20794(-) / protein_length=288 / sequence_SO=supercontig / SO=protein_coding / is_pseudo=false
MKANASRKEDIPPILFANGILGIRGFWKVSAVCEKLLALRNDVTPLGLGSMCSNFDNPLERAELAKSLNGFIFRDNVKALQQVLALPGVEGRCPFLLKRALEESPGSQKCIDFLSKKGPTTASIEVSSRAVSFMTRQSLKSLLDSKVITPDAWILCSDRADRPNILVGVSTSGEDSVPRKAVPLLVALIDAGKLDCAEFLFDAGARVDLCGWEETTNRDRGAVYVSTPGPLQALVSFLTKGWPHNLPRDKGLALLERFASRAREAGCAGWAVYPNASLGRAGRGDVTV